MTQQQQMFMRKKGFAPVVRTYDSGSGNDVAPTGATQVFMECFGPGFNGTDGAPDPGPGGDGGGGGGYCSRTAPCAGGDTLAYNVGVVGSSNSTLSGNLTGFGAVNMSANRSTSRIGGTATGGTTNTSGTDGTIGTSEPSIGGPGGNCPNGGTGGSGGTGAGGAGTHPGGGGGGSGRTGAPGAGAAGRVRLTYT